MSDLLVARRYAKALYDLAVGRDELDAVDAAMDLVAATVNQSRELTLLFESPVISREKKKNVVRSLFSERVCPLALDFILLLIDKGREQALAVIASAYRTLRDSQEGVVEATARAAEPVTAEAETQLRLALEAKTGKRIRLKIRQDPSIVGGLVVRVGDVVYDGSVRNSLAQLREQFGLGNVRQN